MRWVHVFINLAVAASFVACDGSDTQPGGADGGAGESGMPSHVGKGDASPEQDATAGCATADDCVHPISDPPGCVVAECAERRCTYHTQDADGDGHFAQDACRVTDGSVTLVSGDDCADDDPGVHPGAWDGPAGTSLNGEALSDACNHKDDNCDGLRDNLSIAGVSCKCADQEHQDCWADKDGAPIPYPANQLDGVGTCHRGFQTCDDGTWSPCYNAKGPEREFCDGQDNDCNGKVDDDATDEQPYYCDHDRDEHLAPGTKPEVTCPNNLTDCEGGIWRSLVSQKNLFDDCDDTKPASWTGNPEICDGVDNDCDPEKLVDQIRSDDGGLIDLKITYYRDADGDGFGDPGKTKHVCPQQVDGYVDRPGDCDDSDSKINPTASEVCDGVDNDCDGKIDDRDPKLSGKHALPGTDTECKNGKWHITVCPGTDLDCDDDPLNGCETDGSTRDNCHACGRACGFSCGATGCDEVASISAGGSHTCAVTEGGVAACWGSNEYGQLGDERVSNSSAKPIRVNGLPSPVYAIAARLDDTCAIAGPDRVLYCWGDNQTQQIGASAARERETVPFPEAVDDVPSSLSHPSLLRVSKVALSGAHACAIHDGARLACWGANYMSEVRDQSVVGDVVNQPMSVVRQASSGPATEVDDAKDVSAGDFHTCIINGLRQVECWGMNSDGQAGADGTTDPVAWPRVVGGLTDVKGIGAGSLFTCALVDAGDVYCWGNNDFGQLGSARPTSANPEKVPGVALAQELAVGQTHACAATLTGAVTCWGCNINAQCASAPAAEKLSPHVLQSFELTHISAGNAHGCATDPSRKAYCWGSNDSGQLGIGSVGGGDQTSPIPLLPLQ